MTGKEFNLSDRILDCYDTEKLEVEDIKEFIKILRKKINSRSYSITGLLEFLDKLAGDKLITK